MQKIVPHLWFDSQAIEATAFYAEVFENSRVIHTQTLHNTPSGDCDIVSFEIRGEPFMAISAGPYFKINPSISFIVNFDPSRDKNSKEHIDTAWEKLADGGVVRMPIGEYPFSKRFGWIEDKYGVSWQLILTDPQGDERPSVVPSLLFTKEVCGKAEEAMNFYTSIFKPAKKGVMMKYPAGMEPEKEGTVMFADMKLLGTWIAVMDSAHKHEFGFNEAVSFIVKCNTQEEIDYYWEKLSAVPESEQCGWLKDKFGLSWQIVPTRMQQMMQKGTPEQIKCVTQAFLKMKKFDIATLEKAYTSY